MNLSKRNKMISFKETKTTTLTITEPECHELYEKLVTEGRTVPFKEIRYFKAGGVTESLLTLLDLLGEPVYKYEGDISCTCNFKEAAQILKEMKSKLDKRKWATELQLYLAIGFIKWREKDAGKWLNAPLILVPVEIDYQYKGFDYSIKYYGEKIITNQEISFLFEQDYGVQLPEFANASAGISSYIEKVEQEVAVKSWTIEPKCCLFIQKEEAGQWQKKLY